MLAQAHAAALAEAERLRVKPKQFVRPPSLSEYQLKMAARCAAMLGNIRPNVPPPSADTACDLLSRTASPAARAVGPVESVDPYEAAIARNRRIDALKAVEAARVAAWAAEMGLMHPLDGKVQAAVK